MRRLTKGNYQLMCRLQPWPEKRLTGGPSLLRVLYQKFQGVKHRFKGLR